MLQYSRLKRPLSAFQKLAIRGQESFYAGGIGTEPGLASIQIQ